MQAKSKPNPSQMHLAVDVADGQVEAHDLVADEQFHAGVVLEERDQLAVGADLVLDVAHQRTQARLLAAVRVALHPTCTNTSEPSLR